MFREIQISCSIEGINKIFLNAGIVPDWRETVKTIMKPVDTFYRVK